MDEQEIRNTVIEGYRNILCREPDHEGLDVYINHIKSGMSIYRFYEMLRTSDEYKQKFGIKFSLLCPTRGRLNLLENLISSIQNTADNLGNIELLFAVDNDDIETNNHFNGKKYPFKVKVFTRNRSDCTNRDYYNWLIQFSEGKYLWTIGNDVAFKVKNWDGILSEKIEEYLKDKPDRIACFGPKDNTPKPTIDSPPFPCFPIITREAYNFFGFFLHSEIKTWGADTTIHALYSGANRYLPIGDRTYLEHISYHTGMAGKDDIVLRIESIFCQSEKPGDIIRDIVPAQIMKLKAAIDK